MSKKLKFQVFKTAFALICLTAIVGYLPGAHADITITSMSALGDGAYRWLDVADQPYGSDYQSSYAYSQATVQVTYGTAGTSLTGTLTASNLKPNFAYQVKLVGNPEDPSNEQIGYAGRWWREQWDPTPTEWINGQNLNNKGSGYYPTPNDNVYLTNSNELDPSSPTGHKYRFTGYCLFDYFITDNNGAATVQFETGNSYHVLWNISQLTRTSNDGPYVTSTFQPSSSQTAYDTDYPSHIASIFGEWERLPPGQVNLTPGIYNCQIVLTEESFHGSGGALAGNWAGAMTANLNFSITPELPVPEYPLAGLTALLTCIGAFILFKKRDSFTERLRIHK